MEKYQEIQMLPIDNPELKPLLDSLYPGYKIVLYYRIGVCFYKLKDYEAAISYFDKTYYYGEIWSDYQVEAVYFKARSLQNKGDDFSAKRIMEKYISQYLTEKGYQATDCWEKPVRDHFLGELYYKRALLSNEGFDYKKYLIIAACWGCADAIKKCQELKIWFHIRPTNYTY